MSRLALALAVLASGCTQELEVLSRDAFDADAGPNVGVESCTPGLSCPAGATFRRDGVDGLCLWEGLDFPEGAAVEHYCQYFEDSYMGFSWSRTPTDSGFVCPFAGRNASHSTTGYCLWEGYGLPPGAVAECDELVIERRMGFRWPCP